MRVRGHIGRKVRPVVAAFGLASLLLLPVALRSEGRPTYVAPNHFAGLWYEMARIEHRFQRGCIASTIELLPAGGEEFTIFNRCFLDEVGGELRTYRGRARMVESGNAASLDFTYFRLFTRRYQLLYLSVDRQSAIMADPQLEQLWIIHRRPQIEPTELNRLTNITSKYINTSQLLYTEQDPQGRYK